MEDSCVAFYLSVEEEHSKLLSSSESRAGAVVWPQLGGSRSVRGNRHTDVDEARDKVEQKESKLHIPRPQFRE